jgi:hypothetical protein
MSTKSYTLIPHCLQEFKVDKKVFSPVPEGDSRVLKVKKTILKSRYGMCLSIFLFLSELGTCPQTLIPTRGVEH